MRQSLTLIPTLREVPADAEAKSHQLSSESRIYQTEYERGIQLYASCV